MPFTTLPKALTLDVGYTFLFPGPPLGEVYAAKAFARGFRIEAEEAERRFAESWESVRRRRRERGQLFFGSTWEEGLELWLEVNRPIFPAGHFDQKALRDFIADLYEGYTSPSLWKVDSGLDDLLRVCAEREIRTALVSNWDARLRKLLENLSFIERFHEIVISAEHAVEKPDPKIFNIALEKLGVKPAETVHVGDTWSADITGARACGMGAVWVNPGAEKMPEPFAKTASVSNIAELASLLSNCP